MNEKYNDNAGYAEKRAAEQCARGMANNPMAGMGGQGMLGASPIRAPQPALGPCLDELSKAVSECHARLNPIQGVLGANTPEVNHKEDVPSDLPGVALGTLRDVRALFDRLNAVGSALGV